MARARVLIVHDVARTRALLADLLVREGLHVEAAESTYDAVARFVEKPSDLIVLGLPGLAPAELKVIRTFKREPTAPAVIVTFPSSARDLAVRALEEGADGYVIEPFYAPELLAVVRANLRSRAAPPSSAALPLLAREVAHAVNNPMQVVMLLLQKDKATKKEIVDGVTEQLERVQRVVALLKEFGSIPEAELGEHDPVPIVRRAAREAGIAFEATDVAPVLVDERHFHAAITALLDTLKRLAGEHWADARADLREEEETVSLRVVLPEAMPWETTPRELLDAVFVVRGDREVLAGLMLPRALIESQRGSLAVERDGKRVRVLARVPKARGRAMS